MQLRQERFSPLGAKPRFRLPGCIENRNQYTRNVALLTPQRAVAEAEVRILPVSVPHNRVELVFEGNCLSA